MCASEETWLGLPDDDKEQAFSNLAADDAHKTSKAWALTIGHDMAQSLVTTIYNSKEVNVLLQI